MRICIYKFRELYFYKINILYLKMIFCTALFSELEAVYIFNLTLLMMGCFYSFYLMGGVGGGWVDSIHLIFTCEIKKETFWIFFCHQK